MKGKQSKCPNCGKFVEHDADGFYDKPYPYDPAANVVQYCDEKCCDMQREKDKNFPPLEGEMFKDWG